MKKLIFLTLFILLITNSNLFAESKKVDLGEILSKLYQSHLWAAKSVNDFDEILDTTDSSPLKSDVYKNLMALKVLTALYEDKTVKIYILHLKNFLKNSNINSKQVLNRIIKFIEGRVSEKNTIPYSLQFSTVSNLVQKIQEALKVIAPEIDISDQKILKTLNKYRGIIKSKQKSIEKYFLNNKNIADTKTIQNLISKELKKHATDSINSEVEKTKKNLGANKLMDRMPDSNRTLYPSASRSGNITGKLFPPHTWSLTFDDGPANQTTLEILNNLKIRNMTATFFMLAKKIKVWPENAIKIRDAGMEVAHHSYTHKQLTRVSDSVIDYEITTAKEYLETYFNQDIKLMRLPYGAGVNSKKIRSKIAENNMLHVYWNVDTLDWKDKNPRSIYERALKQIKRTGKDAGVVLFHDIHAQTVLASKMLMDYFLEKQNRVCTVSDVVDEINGLESNCPKQVLTASMWNKIIENSISSLCQQTKNRVTSVNNSLSYNDLINGRCMNYSEYHKYSTPKRDSRVKESISSLFKLKRDVDDSEQRDEVSKDLILTLDLIFKSDLTDDESTHLMNYCKIEYKTSSFIDLNHVVTGFNNDNISFHPNDSLKHRWGLVTDTPLTDCLTHYR